MHADASKFELTGYNRDRIAFRWSNVGREVASEFREDRKSGSSESLFAGSKSMC